MKTRNIKDRLTSCKHDESSEVALKIIQMPSWHPFIAKFKEVISSEKSTLIVMDYVMIDENSDREIYDYNNILTERMAKF